MRCEFSRDHVMGMARWADKAVRRFLRNCTPRDLLALDADFESLTGPGGQWVGTTMGTSLTASGAVLAILGLGEIIVAAVELGSSGRSPAATTTIFVS